MPMIEIKTNVDQEQIAEETHSTITDLCSKHLQKPSSVIWVTVDSGLRMTMGGTFDPTAIVRVECIGRLKPKVNLNLAKDLEEAIVRLIHIPKERIVIVFCKLPGLFCAYNGSLLGASMDYDEDLES